MKKISFFTVFLTILSYSNAVVAWTPIVDDIKKAGGDVSREAQNCISGGCDPGKVAKKGLKSAFSSAAEGASEGVEDSVTRAIDHIFDEQVDPLLERAGILGEELVTHAGDTAEAKAKNIIDYAVKDKYLSKNICIFCNKV